LRSFSPCFLAGSLVLATLADAQQCSPFWVGIDAPLSPLDRSALAVFDDGGGWQLYAAGRIVPQPGWAGVPSVARWNGVRWETINEGLPAREQIGRLLALDDGTGERLHVLIRRAGPGGDWVNYRWSGMQWEPAAPEFGGPNCYPLLMVRSAGVSTVFGLQIETHGHAIRQWTGAQWETIGITNTDVTAVASFDVGSGPHLHVAGSFNSINGISLSRIARWTGDSWEPLGTGIPPGAGGIRHMITHDDGRGPALYVTDILQAGGIPVNRIGRWDGRSWSDVGGGGISSIPITTIHVLASFDDGFGPALFAGGYMHSTGHGLPLRRIARFDGVQWDDVGGGLGGAEPQSMVVYDDGRGPSLFVGGVINSAGAGAPGSTFGIAQWVGCHNQCYVNCDNSRVGPRLNIDDFTCFINKFAVGDPYVDCDGDRQRTIADFHCFMTRFAQGCE
jgi:hypothetical protein